MAFLFREVAFGATLLKHGQLAVHIALLSLTYYNIGSSTMHVGSDLKKVVLASLYGLCLSIKDFFVCGTSGLMGLVVEN